MKVNEKETTANLEADCQSSSGVGLAGFFQGIQEKAQQGSLRKRKCGRCGGTGFLTNSAPCPECTDPDAVTGTADDARFSGAEVRAIEQHLKGREFKSEFHAQISKQLYAAKRQQHKTRELEDLLLLMEKYPDMARMVELMLQFHSPF